MAAKGQGPGRFSSPAEGTKSSAGLGQHRKIDSKGQRSGSYRTFRSTIKLPDRWSFVRRNASQPSLANLRFLGWARETASPLGLKDALSLLPVSVLKAEKTLPFEIPKSFAADTKTRKSHYGQPQQSLPVT